MVLRILSYSVTWETSASTVDTGFATATLLTLFCAPGAWDLLTEWQEHRANRGSGTLDRLPSGTPTSGQN
jgi:HAE1 family hydrophobic/amphiphilic exporter-1